MFIYYDSKPQLGVVINSFEASFFFHELLTIFVRHVSPHRANISLGSQSKNTSGFTTTATTTTATTTNTNIYNIVFIRNIYE